MHLRLRHKPFTPLHIMLGALLLIAAPLKSALACDVSDIRYANSTNRIYIEQPVSCTLTDLTNRAPASALEMIDATNQVWVLRANIIIENGGELKLHSGETGGDVDELRMISNPGEGNIVYIQPNYGRLDIDGPLITSWDATRNGPDISIDDGRAHIKARSYLDSNGVARESTVNINNAEIAYLGYSASESYGIVFKVKAKREETAIFDQVNIYGSITNSLIHDNYMGFYSWGAYGVLIDNNEVYDNITYGIDPHDNSDALTITNNHVHNNGNHGIICSQHCDNLVISDNLVEYNRHGIMLHRSVSDTLVENNISRYNSDTGIALFESFNNIVRNNQVIGNKNGIRLSVGSYNNQFQNNWIKNNSKYSLYFYKGNDIPDVTDGRNRNNQFISNTIEGYGEAAIKLTDSDDNLFRNNTFNGSGNYKFYQASGNILEDNNYSATPVNIHSKGNTTTTSSNFTYLDNDAVVYINSFGVLTLKNSEGRVLLPEESSLPISINTAGTNLTLNSGQIGSKSTIVALDFWVTPQVGTVTIINPVWSSSKSWQISAAMGSETIGYKLGGLTANTVYTIKKNNSVFSEFTSDSEGEYSFIDTLSNAGQPYFYLVQSGDAESNPIVINATSSADSYIRAGAYAATNFGELDQMQVKNKGAGNPYTREGLLKFNLAFVSTPDKVVLKLPAKLSSSDSSGLQIHAVSDVTWDEYSLTYNNRPAYGATIGSFSLTNTDYQTFNVDVTQYVAAQIQQGKSTVSFALTGFNSGTAVIKIVTRENNQELPTLQLTYN